MIQVEDNGPGIPLEEQERIFIPFFTTKKQGSGIGLSLSRQIMRMHGGSITLTSQPGKGTIFTLSF
jgi:signal transduction histidine kinase